MIIIKRNIKFIALLLALSLFASIPAYAEQVNVYEDQQLVKSLVFPIGSDQYFVNNQVPGQKMDAKTFVENGRTYVPVRYLARALGLANEAIKFEQVGNDKQVTLYGKNVLELIIGKKLIIANGETKQIDAAPLVRKYPADRTYLPARYVAEGLGYQVDWNSENQVVLCWPQGEAKPDVTPVLQHLKKEVPKDVAVKVSEIGTPMLDKKWTGSQAGNPDECPRYGWLTDKTRIHYITMADLKAKSYEVDGTRILDVKADRNYVYVKQHDDRGGTSNRVAAVEIVLAEGQNIARIRHSDIWEYPAGTFEARYAVVNDRRDHYANLPTCDITKVTHIMLVGFDDVLAIENPLYKGGR